MGINEDGDTSNPFRPNTEEHSELFRRSTNSRQDMKRIGGLASSSTTTPQSHILTVKENKTLRPTEIFPIKTAATFTIDPLEVMYLPIEVKSPIGYLGVIESYPFGVPGLYPTQCVGPSGELISSIINRSDLSWTIPKGTFIASIRIIPLTEDGRGRGDGLRDRWGVSRRARARAVQGPEDGRVDGGE